MKSKKNLINDNLVDSFFSYTEQAFKDSLEEGINLTKDNILIPDSLNNTLIKNSFINVDDDSIDAKAAFFSNVKDLTKIRINHCDESSSSPEKEPNEAETKKIHYKYMSNYNLSDELTKNKGKEYFWFAAYDKLIKTKHFKKILAYYSSLSPSASELKEKALIIKDFELTLGPKPFVHQKKGSFIFVKLYYLPIEAFNYIFNYVNKIEHALDRDVFTFANMTGNTSVIDHNGIKYPYSCLCNLGSFLNVNIYTFTYPNHQQQKQNSNQSNPSAGPKHKLIKTHKISKLIKYLMEVFPYYSSDFFIYYFYQNSNCFLMNKEQPVINEQVAQIKSYLNKKTNIQTVNISNFNVNVKLTNQVITCFDNCNGSSVGNDNSKKSIEVNSNNNNKHNKTACTSFSNSISKGPILNNNIIKKKDSSKHMAVRSFNNNNQHKRIDSKLNNLSVFKINTSSTSQYKANISAATGIENRNNNNDSTTNQVSIKRNSIYVVNRKFKCEQDFNCDDDSSIITNKVNETEVYLTPPKKKASKYYS